MGAISVRVVKYLKGRMSAVLVILALLMVQAFCDLALPAYTADIVDVGIQQTGIQDAVPDRMQSETFGGLRALLPTSDEELLVASYDEGEDGTYVLNDQGRRNSDSLDQALPAALVLLSQYGGDVDVNALIEAYDQGSMTKNQLREQASSAFTALSQAGDATVRQQAISAIRSEYEACGVDLQSVQMSYLLSIGLRMIGVTLVGALAAIAISFVASRTGASIG